MSISAASKHDERLRLVEEKLKAIAEDLDAGCRLSGSPETAREGVSRQLKAAWNGFRLLGFDTSKLGPLRVLIGALEELDHGFVDPILEPVKTGSTSPMDLIRVWEARASLVVAVEAQRAKGVPLAEAATRVSQAVGRPDFTGESGKRILDWRDRLSRAPGGKAPKEGEHWETLEEGQAKIKDCQSLKEPERHAQLEQLYGDCLKHARVLLPDMALRKMPRANPG